MANGIEGGLEMRKKAIALLLVTMLSVTGCGVDPLSQDTMDKISSIGEVELSDQSLIEDLEKTYSEMTEKQKNQVKNYVDLKNARTELDDLIQEEEARKAAEEEKRLAEEAAQRDEIASSIPYSQAIDFCKSLKASCKDPSSFVLYDVVYSIHTVDDGGSVNNYYIDYSAVNSFGGVVRDQEIACYGDSLYYGHYSSDDVNYEAALEVLFGSTNKNEIETLDADFISSYL